MPRWHVESSVYDRVPVPDEYESPKGDLSAANAVPANANEEVPAELLRRYFATEPPFEHGERKKHEFPDAFALLSLSYCKKK